MFEVITFYLIFSVATAITSVLSFWTPSIKAAKSAGIDNSLIVSPAFGTLIYFCLAFVFAPIMFVILFNKQMSAHYLEGIQQIINEPDTDE
jgi:hypothetical protein